jgi:hypothetical protein
MYERRRGSKYDFSVSSMLKEESSKSTEGERDEIDELDEVRLNEGRLNDGKADRKCEGVCTGLTGTGEASFPLFSWARIS